MKTIRECVSVDRERPIRVVQFGAGNFLRAFADEMIDAANEQNVMDGSIAIVKNTQSGDLRPFREQDCLYTVLFRGKQNGETVNTARVVTAVRKAVSCYEEYDEYIALARLDTVRFVISNTTEAGIAENENDRLDGIPESYPGKLTQFLYERFRFFGGDEAKGLIVLPVELIEDNGDRLKACVLSTAARWELPAAFAAWIGSACIFCNTLVDRIVTGYPKEEAEKLCETLGYSDALLDVAEPFGLWVIESERDISAEFPLDRAGAPVLFTKNLKPYRERKVRILNGAHTSTVLLGWLAGLETVRDCMEDGVIRAFMEKAVREEIIPFVRLPAEEVEAFAADVAERFENPFLRHKVLDISLNSVSKWKTRVLPSVRDYAAENGVLPAALTFSFAALLAFYTADEWQGRALRATRADKTEYAVRDGDEVLRRFCALSGGEIGEYVRGVAQDRALWGEDLTLLPGFVPAVCRDLAAIRADARAAAEQLLRGEL